MKDPYRHYFDVMPAYLTVQDRQFRIIEANQVFINDFGPFEGRHCYEAYKHRKEKCEVCPVEKTFVDGRRHSSEEKVRCLDGRDVSVIVFSTPIKNEYGEITAVMEMSADITEIKRLQEQLWETQERFRLLFEEVPCYISVQDSELRIVEANRRFREEFGGRLGGKCYEIYKHRNEACVPCAVQETFADGQVHRSEEVVRSRDGQKVNTLVYTAPIYDADGRMKSVMEMSTNITPIRELQSQLESIGLLISSISHGIKGLLTGLDGGMYLVNSGMKKDNRQRLEQGWEMVQRNIERIRDTVLNILYYAKEREPNYEAISASDLAAEVFGLIEPKAAEHGVELKKNFDPDAGTFEADLKAVRSLLVNVAENSLDACRVDKKKSDHNVTLGVRGEPENILFEIADNGIGMDEETVDKAFSLFYSSKGLEGTGLGLFIANNIAKAHGGNIKLESELDRGTRFVITIPRKRMDQNLNNSAP